MEKARSSPHPPSAPVRTTNRKGRSPVVLICDHASNFTPDQFGTLGLDRSEIARHIAWDPGAAPLAQRMAAMVDAVLIELRVSRLVIDCTRPLDAPDLIPADQVYFTLERHTRSLGLACVVIEIHNDEISATAGQRKGADLLTCNFVGIHTPEPSISPEFPAAARQVDPDRSNPIIRQEETVAPTRTAFCPLR